jgi:hypothetical protein
MTTINVLADINGPLFFDDWQVAVESNQAQRTNDSSSFTRADTFPDLMGNVRRCESKHVAAAESARAAKSLADDEASRVSQGTGLDGSRGLHPTLVLR